ncbi:MAG: hypothetical protein UX99_C0007G0048 [Candidatus Amesbacteria bacterium GW2011_GWB1_47_26]|uniref:Amidinotransferase n=1 Tax=Candidatus Amesbacteria bacterium GW2011_GWC2_45_19 TaxID=1618366 RepID=A0A0G1M392_9BACT|nr:MAG: hypothetical protein UX05_C0010G0026 [Candidatus Amesbacteria bacterium GW2011_GWC2_45_19]KKU38101.1 MAG: hypothetical protein UX52_C0011G0031 [Candidatus Amesbacteria bacterium GW2011_GWA1_46_35]KKU69073.1 MAG: hypothetical protein UX93_C0003G0065 [Microgenomates group bacterium GW2011_GWC1_47_20]KKU74760.1 MAG: hypothetical protein UX99_C0007G0048 [Candidatus Amesbacteria bacterium GW2011_GWB1_47_26]KKU80191.1 MAG: hypothetical protein UY06_C0004G0012 [Candidatus Amesbacteria bacteriu
MTYNMARLETKQVTNSFVMVRPSYFGFNAETGKDNTFQSRVDSPEDVVRQSALSEFGAMVETLERSGLKIVVLESPLGPSGEITPDAIFPNNWFSTHPKTLVLYPMKAANRRWERQPENLTKALLGMNVIYPETIDLTADEQNGLILEGTGSLVLDRQNRTAYALGSQRTNEQELQKWCETMKFKPHFFHAVDFGGRPVYHTNVVMSVGEGFAVVCTEAIQSANEKECLINALRDTNKTVVEITMNQMYNMCGNILQTINVLGDHLVIMSQKALKAFSNNELKMIERNGLVVPVRIDTIETVGGGSARCMMAEVF